MGLITMNITDQKDFMWEVQLKISLRDPIVTSQQEVGDSLLVNISGVWVFRNVTSSLHTTHKCPTERPVGFNGILDHQEY